MSEPRTILITGAAGNLGSRLARHLLPSGHRLRLMVHRRRLPEDLERAPNVTPVRADLADTATLGAAIGGADAVVHFAGALFAPRPERFLPETNTRWFSNLLTGCLAARVGRVILVSFPQVEGSTSMDAPATGRLDREPISVHARTRLEAERLLMQSTNGSGTEPVVLRCGLVYGRGIRLIEAAHWLARHRLLGVWKDPTWMQLISTADFLTASQAAVLRPGVGGIYHVADEAPLTVQQFLDTACRVWRLPPPRRLPVSLLYGAAWLCEVVGLIAHQPSPLTRDIIRIARVSHCGDTRRARKDLIPVLAYPTLESGLGTL